MSADYISLAIIAVLAIGGGMFLLLRAKRYRAHREASKHRH